MNRMPSLYDKKYKIIENDIPSSVEDWHKIIDYYKGPIEFSLIEDKKNIKFFYIRKEENNE